MRDLGDRLLAAHSRKHATTVSSYRRNVAVLARAQVSFAGGAGRRREATVEFLGEELGELSAR
jgi:hypothetical protein